MARNICTKEGCDRVVHGHGLCNKHYNQWRFYAVPEDIGANGCSVEYCDRVAHALDMCTLHYWRSKRGAPLTETAEEQHQRLSAVERNAWVSKTPQEKELWRQHLAESRNQRAPGIQSEAVRRGNISRTLKKLGLYPSLKIENESWRGTIIIPNGEGNGDSTV